MAMTMQEAMYGGRPGYSAGGVRLPSSAARTSTSKQSTDPAALKKMRSLFEEAKAIYAPDGKYMAGIEANVQRGEKKAIAGGMQGLAAAGLAGTSMMGGLAKKYQEEVAQPALAQATTARLSAMSGILSQEAGMEGSMAARTTTSTSPLAASYGGGGGGGGGTDRAPSYQRSQAQPVSRSSSTKKFTPSPITRRPYNVTKQTGQVYFGAATYAKKLLMGPPVGGDVARVATPSSVPLSTSAYGMDIGMNNYLNSGN